ncbi:hypothetical protein [Glaciecola sp. KUL10]|uniref:hypothetical protein n=1 Tax=Glaciecola sp. (strain KUL10) TaxID=2161813 RepID=UPI0011B65B45|nr:hypothetical protein [Glaciecola sp. KUL10]
MNTSYDNSNELVCRHYIDDYAKTGKQDIISIEEQTYLRVLRQETIKRGLDLESCVRLIDGVDRRIAENILKVGTAILVAAVLNEQLTTKSKSNSRSESYSYEELRKRYERSVRLATLAGVPKSKIAKPTTRKSTQTNQVSRIYRPIRSVSVNTSQSEQNSINTSASCTCSCVNGEVQPLCTSRLAIKPICSPRLCPNAPLTIKPIKQQNTPPIGSKSCSLYQVYNESKEKYEWEELCD